MEKLYALLHKKKYILESLAVTLYDECKERIGLDHWIRYFNSCETSCYFLGLFYERNTVDWIFNRFIHIINSLGMLEDKACKSQLIDVIVINKLLKWTFNIPTEVYHPGKPTENKVYKKSSSLLGTVPDFLPCWTDNSFQQIPC